MNAYVIRTLKEICLYHETEIEPHEDGIAYDIIIAQTRGQARAAFCQLYNIDFTEQLRIVKLYGEDIDPFAVETKIQASVQMYNLSNPEEWLEWRFEFLDDPL